MKELKEVKGKRYEVTLNHLEFSAKPYHIYFFGDDADDGWAKDATLKFKSRKEAEQVFASIGALAEYLEGGAAWVTDLT
jgi:hypothetical protein